MVRVKTFISIAIPGFYVFFIVPFDLLRVNYYELNGEFKVFIFFLLLLILWISIAAWLVIRKNVVSENLQYLFLAAFFTFFAFDVLTPTTLNELTGDDEQTSVREPIRFLLLESNLVIFLILGYFFILRKKLLISFATLTAGLFLFFFTTSTLSFFISNTIGNESKINLDQTDDANEFLPNIYHIVLDAYSSNVFLETIGDEGLSKDFADFTFYEMNRSNYEHTNMSTASFLQGKMFDHTDTVESFINSGRRENYLKNLISLGYRLSFYDHGRNWALPESTFVINASEINPPSGFFSTQELIVLDFWFLRLTPTFLQKNVYQESGGVASKFLTSSKIENLNSEDRRTYDGKLLLEQLIKDESNRKSNGELIFVHSYLTHGPYVFDKDCEIKQVQDENYYLDQVRCANSVIIDFLENLKRLNRFSNSIVIIHSDHGSWEIGSNDNPLSEEDKKLLAVTNLRSQPGDFVDNQSKALLLIKLPSSSDFEGSPLKISKARTQLIDVVPTIMFEVNKPELFSYQGIPIQSGIPQSRNQIISMGFKQVISDGSTVTMGNDYPELDFIYYELDENNKYKFLGSRYAKWN